MVDDNRAGMDNLIADLNYLRTHSLRVGWVSQPDSAAVGKGSGADQKRDDDGHAGQETVAEVARAHELSLGNLESVQPPRSVLIATFEQETTRIEEITYQFISPVIEGSVIPQIALRFIGEAVVDMIKMRYVAQTNFKPLSDRRALEKVRAGKSGNQARINTGQEINAVRWEIGPF